MEAVKYLLDNNLFGKSKIVVVEDRFDKN